MREDFLDDPRFDDAAVDFTLVQLCKALGLDPESVAWDAATGTFTGDVQAVIGNILRAKYGEYGDPHPHWSAENKNENYPKTLEEWDPHKDPVGHHLELAVARLRVAMDRDDSRAPDEMALISRWDLTTLVHDWWTKCAVFDIWCAEQKQKRGEKPDLSFTPPRSQRDEIARIIDPIPFTALERGYIVPQADEFTYMKAARDKADKILALLAVLAQCPQERGEHSNG